MTRKEMDKLNVGDKIKVRGFIVGKDDVEWIPAEVSNVYVCTDEGKFIHGGYHSVYGKVKDFAFCLDPEFTELV